MTERIEPDLPELLRKVLTAWQADIRVAIPGRVEAYDPAKQVADVLPIVKDVVEQSDESTKTEKLPVIPNVPVAHPSGGGYFFHLPVAKGDFVWLLFNERDITQWRETGQLSEPAYLERHPTSFPVAILGARTSAQTLANVSGDRAVIDGPTEIRLGGPSADFVALQGLVKAELQAIVNKFNAHDHNHPQGLTTGLVLGDEMSDPGEVAASKVKAE